MFVLLLGTWICLVQRGPQTSINLETKDFPGISRVLSYRLLLIKIIGKSPFVHNGQSHDEKRILNMQILPFMAGCDYNFLDTKPRALSPKQISNQHKKDLEPVTWFYLEIFCGFIFKNC